MAWYLPDEKVLFLHISKASGTSVNQWLIDNFDARKHRQKHCRIDAVQSHIKFNLHFTIVRNPYARVHSWYFYHVGLLKKQPNHVRFQKWIEPAEKGFTWWIINSNKTGSTKNSIWWTQKSFIDFGLPHIVCKLENIEEDFKKVQDYLNCYNPLPIANTSKHKHYQKDYNTKTKKIVKDYFQEDLDYFNYNF